MPWLVNGPLEAPTPNGRLRKILQLLDIQEILIVVSNVAEEVIHNLRQEAENCTIEMDALMPESRVDILTFPEEILRTILEFFGQDDNRATIQFGLTYRKFRAVALSFSQLWTTIKTGMMGIPTCEA